MPRRCLHTWPTAAVCLGLLALSTPAGAERLPIRSYTTSDGLPDNIINRIVRDSRGFLWFCTAEGLSQFDGYRFINYGTADGLPHPDVTDLLETREGDYWIATSSGLARFNPRGLPASDDGAAPPPRDRMFTALASHVANRRAQALTALVQARDGTIWAGSWDGLLQLRQTSGGAELLPVDLEPSEARPTIVRALLQDRFGTLWIGTENGLYRRWRNGRVARYGTRTGLPDEFVHDLLEDHHGRLWVATRMGGFFSLTTEAGPRAPTVTRSYRRANGFNDWVFDLYQTSAGRMLAATNHGLFEFPSTTDTTMGTPRLHTTRNGLIYHEIERVMEDGDANLWLGTINGAMKIVGGGVRTFDSQDGVHLVHSLFGSAEGDLYAFGYVAGARSQREVDRGTTSTDVEKYAPRIGRFDGQGFRWLLPDLRGADPSWSPRPFVLQARTGEWWIGSSGGLFRFPRVRSFPELARAWPLAVYTTRHGLAAPTVYTIYEDARGDVWISTVAKPNGVHGLARWDGATHSVRDLAHTPGLPSLRDFLPVSFREDRAGHLWVGFSPGGLGRYTRGRFSLFTEREGLPPGVVNELLVDAAGRLWIATSRGGISRVDDPEAARPTFVTYSTAHGLSSNRVTTMTQDARGRIYAGSGRGLDQLTPTTGRIKRFSAADGLAPGESTAALTDRSGAIWLGTRQGLSRLVPEPERSSRPPPIWISGVRIAGERWNVSMLGEAAVTLPDLPANRNRLQVDFVGVSFAPGETLRYQHRLGARDAAWSEATTLRTVDLAGLAPGSYTFLVRAVNADRVVSPKPAVVSFTILAPVWRRAWFMTLCGVAAGLLLYGLYRYRVSRLLEVERVRTRIASDLHDDIGAALSRIAVLSEIAGVEAKDRDGLVTSRLSVIASASREVLEAMSDIVWAINPRRDQVRDLTQRMRRFASDVLTARQIAFSFRAPHDERHLEVAADVRRHVLLVFKEAVNNIVRHSACTKADVELRVHAGQLALTVRDDGHGFDPTERSDGTGLQSMHDRARAMGGELRVDSCTGQGTTITLTVARRATVNERQRRLQRSMR